MASALHQRTPSKKTGQGYKRQKAEEKNQREEKSSLLFTDSLQELVHRDHTGTP
jgi:hypothetical protein